MANLNSFQQSLTDARRFISTQNSPPYYVYCNFTNKYCSIHSTNSIYLPHNIPDTPQVFKQTPNGFWYGPIQTYFGALSIIIIMSDFHHIACGEFIDIINGDGISFSPRKPR